MTSSLFMAAGDVGGARSVLAVISEAVAQGRVCHVLRHGYLRQAELPHAAIPHEIGSRSAGEAARTLLADAAPVALVFGSSVRDTVAVEFAAQAQTVGIPAAHLLDHWTAYRARMRLPDGSHLEPRIYAVPDEIARKAALADGIAAGSLRVTGSPALAKVAEMPRWRSPQVGGPLRLVFVSEPVSADQGDDPASLNYRGYTEFQVLELLAECLRTVAAPILLDVLPHPRENPEKMHALWRKIGRGLGTVLSPADRDRSLAGAHGIVGMASILLYEMWLRGYPVFSLQPGLRQASYRVISTKPGIAACEQSQAAGSSLGRWLQSLPAYAFPPQADAELRCHQVAAAAFLETIDTVLKGYPRRPA